MTTQDSQGFQWRYDELDDKNFQIHGRTLFFIIVLFSVILLITLMFLYARWICRSSSTSSAVADTTALSPHVQPVLRPQGLDAAMIESLPITLHQRLSSVGEVECCICLGVFEEGEKVKVLPNCCHTYHCECIDKWLVTHSSCPICRAALLVDSPV
ncbi:putative transcription factor C2H2 family [Helianthus annuus]|nr:putative transcription factor C2H2 family [Helianthus annuus]